MAHGCAIIIPTSIYERGKDKHVSIKTVMVLLYQTGFEFFYFYLLVLIIKMKRRKIFLSSAGLIRQYLN